MSSYNPKQAANAARVLETQRVCAILDISTASAVGSDIESVTASGAIITKAIVLDVGEPVLKCLSVRITNRATGAVVVLNSAPDISVANKISVSAIGTAHPSVCVEFIYIVA
jgi:hypothetical protein